MSDVTAFLRARLDDDEKIANTAIGRQPEYADWAYEGDEVFAPRLGERGDRWNVTCDSAAMGGRSLHLIPGNHDSCHPMANRNSHNRVKAFYEVFDSVQLFARRRISGQKVLLSHFPYWGDHTDEDRGVQFRLQDKGEWLLHGHTHSQERRPERGEIRQWDGKSIFRFPAHKQIHVGWDAWGQPVELEEIASIIEGVDQ